MRAVRSPRDGSGRRSAGHVRIAHVLFGDYADSPNDSLFPFRFVLSYTSFTYSDPRVSAAEERPSGRCTASENTGVDSSAPGTRLASLPNMLWKYWNPMPSSRTCGLLADHATDVELEQRPRDELRARVAAGGVLALRRVVVGEAVERQASASDLEGDVPDRLDVEVDVVALVLAQVAVVVPLLSEMEADVQETRAEAELEVGAEVERALLGRVVRVLGLEVHPGLDVDVPKRAEGDHRRARDPVDADAGPEDRVETQRSGAAARGRLDVARLLDDDLDEVVAVPPRVDVLELDGVARDVGAVGLVGSSMNGFR